VKTFLLLARMRILETARSKSSALFVTLFPVALLVCLGLVFARGHPFERRTVIVVMASADIANAQRATIDALRHIEDIRVQITSVDAAAQGALHGGMASAVLTWTRELLPELLVGPHDRLFGQALSAALPDTPAIRVARPPRFGYVRYLFPGILAFSIRVSGLFGLGYTMVSYRQSGFLKKLATTPVQKATFVGAQISGRTLLVLVQVGLLVATAALGFGLPLTGSALFWLPAICVLGLLVFLGIGFSLACVIRTESLIVDVISAANIPLVFLSEIFFPLDELPRPLARIGSALPSTEVVRLLRSVLLYGAEDPAELGPGLLLLALWAAASFAVSLWVFKWHK
jgi:ABC-type polysaccharide/polyol phosphate export permease